MLQVDYRRLLQESFLDVIRKALVIIGTEGAPYESGVLIRYRTGTQGVVLTNKLRGLYPDVMTVILQHQFEELVAGDRSFSVTLSFLGETERITVPYHSILSYQDLGQSIEMTLESGSGNDMVSTADDEEIDETPAEVIKLDSFRKS